MSSKKEFIDNTIFVAKVGPKLLFEHGIAEQTGKETLRMTLPFVNLWEIYSKQQRSIAMGLVYTVMSFCEGKTSRLENSIICQTIHDIIKRDNPNCNLSKEMQHMGGDEPLDPAIAERIAKEAVFELKGK